MAGRPALVPDHASPMANPTLLFSTAPFFRQPLRRAFRMIADAGFDAVEVMVTQDPSTQEPHLVSALAREFGLTVGAVHAPFLLVTRRVWGIDPVEKIYRGVHMAEETGATLLVVHPPYRWQTRYRRWIEERLAGFSAASGVTIAVENMFPLRLPGAPSMRFHAEEPRDSLERVPHLVLDTSHAAVSGTDIRQALARDRDRIRHIHLSNNAGKGWDSHLPIGRGGVLPVDEFLADLMKGYEGSVALELDLRPWFDDKAALRELLAQQREHCERFLSPPTQPRRVRT
jgi:sugar phosphate isomerase/epimerase